MNKKGSILIFTIVFILFFSICITMLLTVYKTQVIQMRNSLMNLSLEMELDILVHNFIITNERNVDKEFNGYTIVYDKTYDIYNCYQNGKKVYIITMIYKEDYNIWVNGNNVIANYKAIYKNDNIKITYKEIEELK